MIILLPLLPLPLPLLPLLPLLLHNHKHIWEMRFSLHFTHMLTNSRLPSLLLGHPIPPTKTTRLCSETYSSLRTNKGFSPPKAFVALTASVLLLRVYNIIRIIGTLYNCFRKCNEYENNAKREKSCEQYVCCTRVQKIAQRRQLLHKVKP